MARRGEAYLVGSDGGPSTRGMREEFPDGVTSEGIDQALAQTDGQGLYENYQGEPVIGVYTWQPEVGSALLTEMSQQEAFEPARQVAFTIAIVGLAVVALFGVGHLRGVAPHRAADHRDHRYRGGGHRRRPGA